MDNNFNQNNRFEESEYFAYCEHAYEINSDLGEKSNLDFWPWFKVEILRRVTAFIGIIVSVVTTFASIGIYIFRLEGGTNESDTVNSETLIIWILSAQLLFIVIVLWSFAYDFPKARVDEIKEHQSEEERKNIYIRFLSEEFFWRRLKLSPSKDEYETTKVNTRKDRRDEKEGQKWKCIQNAKCHKKTPDVKDESNCKPCPERVPDNVQFIDSIFSSSALMAVIRMRRFLVHCKDEERNVMMNSFFDRMNFENARTDFFNEWQKFKSERNQAVTQFSRFWFITWFSWAMYYMFSLIQMYFDNIDEMHSVINQFKIFFDGSAAIFIFYSYLSLSITTFNFSLVTWFKYALPLILSTLFCLILDYHMPGKEVTETMKLVHAVLCAVSYASFIGVLNSQYFGLSNPMFLTILMIYGVIQTYTFQLNGADVGQSEFIVYCIAFFFKIMLFLFVTWLLHTRRILMFIMEEHSTHNWKDERIIRLHKNLDAYDSSVFQR